MIDGSDSLINPGNTTTPWAWLRSALVDDAQGLLKRYQHGVRLGLMIYSGRDPTRTVPDAGVQACPALITVDPARDAFDAIAGAYPANAPGGTSPTHLALERLLARLQQPGSGHTPGATQIVLLTDGASNALCELDPADPLASPVDASSVTAQVATAARKLRAAGALLHVVDVGGVYVNAAQQLEAVAKAAGGAVFAASNAGQLERALEEIIHVDAPCDLALEGRATSEDPCGAEVRIAGEKIACGEEDGFRIIHPHLVRLHGAACRRFLQQPALEAQLSFECGKYAPAPGSAACAAAADCVCDSTKVAGAWRDHTTATVFVMLPRSPGSMPASMVDMLRAAFTRSKLDLRLGSLLYPSIDPSAPCTCVNDNPQHWIPGPGACCLNQVSGGCYVSAFGSSDQLGFAPAADWFDKVPSLLQSMITGRAALNTALTEAERAWSMIDPSERLATIMFGNSATACEPDNDFYQRAARQVDGTVPLYVVGSASDPTIQSGLDDLALVGGTGTPLMATDAARLGDSLALLAARKNGRCLFEFDAPISYEHLHLIAKDSDGTTREIERARGRERGYRIRGKSALLTESLCADVLAGQFSELRFETGCVTAPKLCEAASAVWAASAECDATPIASGSRVLDLETDANRAYWFEDSTSGTTLRSEPLAGGSATTLASGFGFSTSFAIDAENAYWATPTNFMKVSLNGGAPTVLASAPRDGGGSGSNTVFDIAVDATHLYYVDTTTGELRKVPLAGGAPILLASGQLGGSAVAVDATHVYWTVRREDGSVRSIPKSGGTPITLAAAQPLPTDLAVDATSVYWVNSGSVAAGKRNGDGAVLKVPLAGGTPVVLASAQMFPTAIAIDASNVYWVDEGSAAPANVADGDVMSVPLNGGTPVALARGQLRPVALSANATHMYWVNYGDSMVGDSQIVMTKLDRADCPNASCP